MKLIFDIETNGLLPELDRVHCVAISDGKNIDSYGPGRIEEALERLENAEVLVGHNIIDFDIPAIQKVYPEFNPKGELRDTLVMSRLIYADLRDRDFAYRKKHDDFPTRYIGSHSLRAWGYRLNDFKSDYEGGWAEWSEEMEAYCRQDVVVTTTLWNRLVEQDFSEESINLEHAVQRILLEQEKYGFAFDVEGAVELYSTLRARHSELGDDLRLAFPAWEVRTPFTPKRNNKRLGYEEGVTIDKVKVVEFNPDSRDHIALKLKEKGWRPTEFTPEGKPKVDETILQGLRYPEAELLEEYLLLTKRLGQISEGPQAWLKKEQAGVIHGRVNTNGAVTGRMTHSHPNLAQVPSTRAKYGKECRALFKAREGRWLTGIDADALELRCLAGYLAIYDGGEYIRTVLEGDKGQGTDMHSINARVLGCDRDTAKTWFYAFIYGAGDKKLGGILGGNVSKGKRARDAFLSSLPALRTLVTRVQSRVRDRGYLVGIDGRKLYIRSSHAALNTLLQSAGAIFMKRGLVILDGIIKESGVDAKFVANVHDEWQIETPDEDTANYVGRAGTYAIRDAGEYYDFKCPLDGNYSIGRTWADTH